MDGKFEGCCALMHSFVVICSYINCFMFFSLGIQGTLLNSKTQISSTTVKALKEVSSRGVKIVIATGKVRTFFF